MSAHYDVKWRQKKTPNKAWEDDTFVLEGVVLITPQLSREALQGGAHLQHVGQVDGNGLQQQAVWRQLGALPAGDVAVAQAHKDPHLLRGCAGVHVVAQRLVDGQFPFVETERTTTETTYWSGLPGN